MLFLENTFYSQNTFKNHENKPTKDNERVQTFRISLYSN